MAAKAEAPTLEIVDMALPKSTSGRKGRELDSAFLEAIAGALQTQATVEVDGETRPRALGAKSEFKTKGTASSEGRAYANALAEKLGKKVRVSVYSAERDKAPFFWRVYLPIEE